MEKDIVLSPWNSNETVQKSLGLINSWIKDSKFSKEISGCLFGSYVACSKRQYKPDCRKLWDWFLYYQLKYEESLTWVWNIFYGKPVTFWKMEWLKKRIS